MIVVFFKAQLPLFDAPVHVSGSIRKDGTVVRPHVRIQKVSAKRGPAQAALFGDHESAPKRQKRSKLDVWIEKKGGLRALARVLSTMPGGQQQRLFAEMAKLGGKTPAEVAAMFEGLALKEPEKGETSDLFSQPTPASKPEGAATDSPIAPRVARPKLSARARRALEVLRAGGYS